MKSIINDIEKRIFMKNENELSTYRSQVENKIDLLLSSEILSSSNYKTYLDGYLHMNIVLIIKMLPQTATLASVHSALRNIVFCLLNFEETS